MQSKWLAVLLALVCGAAASITPCPGCGCMQWSPWISVDTPTDGGGDFETLRFPRPGYGTYITDANGNAGKVARLLWTGFGITCNHPIEIECRDVATRVPFFRTGDYTISPYSVKCTTDEGLVCINSQQQNNLCRNYEVRVLCWTACQDLQWSAWRDTDNPTGNVDVENHQLGPNAALTYEPCPSGSSPYEIQCRRTTGTNALVSGQKRLMCDRNWGFLCLNSFNPSPNSCYDYQKEKLVKVIPLSNLLLETDAPALGPDKEGINVPSNILISCQAIARIKGLPVEVVIEETSKNARRLFSRLPSN